MKNKKRVLLKLTGRVLSSSKGQGLDSETVKNIAKQIKELKETHHFAIVIGGGNILRGDEQGMQMGLRPAVGHQAGMLATIINGIILKDIFEQHGLEAEALASICCPQICQTSSQDKIDKALKQEKIIIFVGGTGAPFFTTDTNTIVRALQVGAKEVWKGTDVDGVYTSDPKKDKDAKLLKKTTYADAISKKLGIIDATALVMAEKHGLPIRVFTIFEKNTLGKASQDKDFGSLISLT